VVVVMMLSTRVPRATGLGLHTGYFQWRLAYVKRSQPLAILRRRRLLPHLATEESGNPSRVDTPRHRFRQGLDIAAYPYGGV